MKTLVLGLGNELYGDDGVGIHVVRQLKNDIEASKRFSQLYKNVHFEECSLSGLALLDRIKIIAVEAKNMYNLGEGLSKEMTKAIPAIVKEVKKILKSK